MTLIADSGSTKTDWCLVENGCERVRVVTQGINPFHQDNIVIEQILRDELLAAIGDEVAHTISRVRFYGAGIRPEMKPRMQDLLRDVLGIHDVEVESDLLGTARALFGNDDGIACILGTGANSGLFVDGVIVANTPPLGYILGDEGSGAVLGKHFVADLCKGLMPNGLLEEYLAETHQTIADIIDAVYRRPMPNRYLAQTARVIRQHLHIEPVRQLVVSNFRAFFSRNLTQYAHPDLPVRAIGSIAFHFRDPLEEAAILEGFHLDRVEVSPMPGLIAADASEREA